MIVETPNIWKKCHKMKAQKIALRGVAMVVGVIKKVDKI